MPGTSPKWVIFVLNVIKPVTAHIRLEERVVFPSVEESLSEAARSVRAARLEVKEEGPRAEP
jgi:hemerythrin-like domain-containing protein